MKHLIRNILDRLNSIASRSRLGMLRPVLNAADGLFFRSAAVTSSAPHIRDASNLKRLFSIVVLSVLPTAIAGIYFFGWRVLAVIAVSYIVGVGTEMVFAVVRKKEISEGAFVTCILFPLVLPPDVPLWMAALGVFVGIMFGKEVFGGTGHNIFNPALVGRAFLYISFPAAMTVNLKALSPDAISSASPLARFKGEGELAALDSLFWGAPYGSIGESSAFLIILGGLFLIITRVSDWRIPLSFIMSSFALSGVLSGFYPVTFAPPAFQLLAGGLLFGAFFMATDPVTSPFTKGGRWAFGAGCGALTILIRGLSGYPEGVMFSILFMNAFSPLIDETVIRFRYRRSGI